MRGTLSKEHVADIELKTPGLDIRSRSQTIIFYSLECLFKIIGPGIKEKSHKWMVIDAAFVDYTSFVLDVLVLYSDYTFAYLANEAGTDMAGIHKVYSCLSLS